MVAESAEALSRETFLPDMENESNPSSAAVSEGWRGKFSCYKTTVEHGHGDVEEGQREIKYVDKRERHIRTRQWGSIS